MPPRETENCDLGIGGRNGRAEIQVLKRNNGTVTTGPRMHCHRVPGKGDGLPTTAGEIPWRTSRRLQEATLRLIKERDGGQPQNHVSIREEEDSGSTESLPASRSPRGRQSDLEPRRQKLEDPAQVPVQGSENTSLAEAEQTSSAAETISSSSRTRKKVKRRRKAQFNEALPLFTQDDLTPATACSTAAGRTKVEPTVAGNGIPPNLAKQPQSCFDLLCSHVGLRGWRCYRSCIAGQAFCVYHRRESTSVAGICLFT